MAPKGDTSQEEASMVEKFTPGEVSRFYSALLPKLNQRGKEWRGPCPVHRGERDSFAVDAETGRAFCHSTCSRGWDMIGLQQKLSGQSFAKAKAEVHQVVGRPQREQIAAEYPYTDAAGKLLFQVIRYGGGA